MKRIKISVNERVLRCGPLCLSIRLGKNGWIGAALGREGDGKTPLGEYHLRFGLYRADRLQMPPQHAERPLNFRPMQADDGWCDAADDPAYNRFVKLPYAASHEALWREDGAYDIVLITSHNDSPPQAPLGSAVFIHIAQPDDRETLGCIALTPDDMVKLLPHMCGDQIVEISV
ncbi:MAG: L,D-transpeptidase family protein [Maricaulaceae bacterium]